MREIEYDRLKAVKYAEEWAFKRNPKYLDFEEIGGDCTNFVSQCVYAGCGVMNFTRNVGWYYISSSERAPSWTSVRFFYEFFTQNQGVGPYAAEVDITKIEIGDVIQLGDEDGKFYHALLIVALTDDEIYCAAHSYDAFMRPLTSYDFAKARFLHIIAARNW